MTSTDGLTVHAQNRSPTSTVVDDNIKVPTTCNLETIFQHDDIKICSKLGEDSHLDDNSAGTPLEENNPMSYLVYPEDEAITYMIPVPKTGTPRDTSPTPIMIMIVKSIGLKQSRAILKVLLDPGSTKTMISRKTLPR